MTVESLLVALGDEIDDPEEESFLLFSQPIPSSNLGFVDQSATSIDISIGGRDLLIHQSPTILSSTRAGGTTGAVLWKITPLFATWLSDPTNPLHTHTILHPSSSILELGSGISGIIALCLAPQIGSYTLTDQEYVLRLLRQNLSENQSRDTSTTPGKPPRTRKTAGKPKRGGAAQQQPPSDDGPGTSNILSKALDWETDDVASLVPRGESFDAVIACDCIYNDALIAPLVQTCVDACRLRDAAQLDSDGGDGGEGGNEKTVCVIAQQLRSDEVFEGWLKAFHRSFRVWRVPDGELIAGLRGGEGFVVHVGVLRE